MKSRNRLVRWNNWCEIFVKFSGSECFSVGSRILRRDLLAPFQDDESRGGRRRRQTTLHRCLNLELGLIKILQADAQLGISEMLGKAAALLRISSQVSAGIWCYGCFQFVSCSRVLTCLLVTPLTNFKPSNVSKVIKFYVTDYTLF